VAGSPEAEAIRPAGGGALTLAVPRGGGAQPVSSGPGAACLLLCPSAAQVDLARAHLARDPVSRRRERRGRTTLLRAYEAPASTIFLSEQIGHQQPGNSPFLSEQTSTSRQPPGERTGCKPTLV
jgi:hypothetical protein